jgi:hypothetical protein
MGAMSGPNAATIKAQAKALRRGVAHPKLVSAEARARVGLTLDDAIERGDVIGIADDQDALLRENDVSKLRKQLRKQIRKAGLDPLAKAVRETGVSASRLARIATLENLLKSAEGTSAPSGYVRTEDFQRSCGIRANLYREAVAAERESAMKAVAATFGGIRVTDSQGSVRAQESALDRATRRDIARTQSASGGGPRSRAIDMFGRSQRGVLRSVIDGTATPEELEGETILESQRRIQDLEGQLRKAANPAERERLGYMLTRAKLIDGHRRGLI